jgi:biopolymer transport protein ExbD/biopolymer transport protein TolR
MKPIAQRRAIYEPLAEINVTPFVDVMLVLLIVFMITAPMLAAGMRVDLPQAKSAQPLNPKEPVIITVRKDGKLFLGREELSPEQVADAVRAQLGDDRERAIHLRGDREVAYGDIVAIVDQLAANGLLKVALLANARGDDRLSASKPSLGENRSGR